MIDVIDNSVCSECGKTFCAYGVWPWKTREGKQCDYNCHNHALLRCGNLGYMTLTNYKKDVQLSEETMKHKGKTILHPIDIKKAKIKKV